MLLARATTLETFHNMPVKFEEEDEDELPADVRIKHLKERPAKLKKLKTPERDLKLKTPERGMNLSTR